SPWTCPRRTANARPCAAAATTPAPMPARRWLDAKARRLKPTTVARYRDYLHNARRRPRCPVAVCPSYPPPWRQPPPGLQRTEDHRQPRLDSAIDASGGRAPAPGATPPQGGHHRPGVPRPRTRLLPRQRATATARTGTAALLQPDRGGGRTPDPGPRSASHGC